MVGVPAHGGSGWRSALPVALAGATVDKSAMAGRLSAKGDAGLLIDRVRCTRKTGRWLITHNHDFDLALPD